MPDHRFKFSTGPDYKSWWRIWNDYPNPTRDALLALFGIAVVGILVWVLLLR